ncbi:MAG: ABC transporter ATP-binding protein [Sneathiellaceae bacterium]
MALEIAGLSVLADGRKVVGDVSLSVGPGRVTAILGANGAGKSELVLAVAGMLPVTAGAVRVDGLDITGRGPDAIRKAGVAAVPEGHRVLTRLSVEDNLRAAGSLQPAGLAAALADTYALFPELAERRQQLAGTLSGGQQQMVALGHALMARPKYILIDEMSLGLAPLIVKRLMGVVADLTARNVGVILIEQFTELALGIADEALVLRNGRTHFNGTAAELKARPDLLDAAYLAFDPATAAGGAQRTREQDNA